MGYFLIGWLVGTLLAVGLIFLIHWLSWKLWVYRNYKKFERRIDRMLERHNTD